jgi:serralysin
VQTASGYDVAWQLPGANEYLVWSTDSSGNYISHIINATSGSDYALQSIETTFNQDLNGDGTIGLTKTVIQNDTNSLGSTSLTAVANEYFLYNGGGSGPALRVGGAFVTAGEFAGWTPIGAVQTASGYDVAWELPGADEYLVWSTDSSGNYISHIIKATSGSDYALQSIETTFNQDLNGDGLVGLYAAPGTTLQISESLAGPSGMTSIGTGATLEISAPDSAAVTFTGSTGMLILDNPSTFTGKIFNFTDAGRQDRS